MNEANETIFNNLKDFVHRESERIITLNLEHKPYDSLKSQDLITVISQQVLMWLVKIIDKLTTTNKNFKYIVNVILLAKGGNGFDIGGLSYFNGDMDGTVSIKWESKYLTCIVIIYGIANSWYPLHILSRDYVID